MDQSRDRELLELVDESALKSKDPSTKIGAVLVDYYDRVVSRACNQFPPGVSEDVPSRWERPAKYFYIEHAERRAIQEAVCDDVEIAGSTLYTTGIPCADCAKAVIGSGVETIVVWEGGSGLEFKKDRPDGAIDWSYSIQVGREMLEEAGIEIRQVKR